MEQAGIDKRCAVFGGFGVQIETAAPRFSALFNRTQLLSLRPNQWAMGQNFGASREKDSKKCRAQGNSKLCDH